MFQQNKQTFHSGKYYHQPSKFGSNQNHYLPRNFFSRDMIPVDDEQHDNIIITQSQNFEKHNSSQTKDKSLSFNNSDQKNLYNEVIKDQVSFQDFQGNSEVNSSIHYSKYLQEDQNNLSPQQQINYKKHHSYKQSFTDKEYQNQYQQQQRQTPFHTPNSSKDNNFQKNLNQCNDYQSSNSKVNLRQQQSQVQHDHNVSSDLQDRVIKEDVKSIQEKLTLYKENMNAFNQEQAIYQKMEQVMKEVLLIKDEEQYLKYCLIQISIEHLETSQDNKDHLNLNNFILYQLDINDIVKSFSKFGKVLKAYVLPFPNQRIGFVQMDSIVNAYKALKSFNHKVVVQNQSILQVKFVFSKEIYNQSSQLFCKIKKVRQQSSKLFQQEFNAIKLSNKVLKFRNPFEQLPQYSQSFEKTHLYNDFVMTQKQLESSPQLYNEYSLFKQYYEPQIHFKQNSQYPYQCWFFIQLEEKHILKSRDQNHQKKSKQNLFDKEELEENEDTFSRLLIGSKGSNINQVFEDIQVLNNGDQLKISFRNQWLYHHKMSHQDIPLFGEILAKNQLVFEDAIKATQKLIKRTFILYNKRCQMRGKEPCVKKIFLKPFIMPQTIQQIKSDLKLTLRKIATILDSTDQRKPNAKTFNNHSQHKGYYAQMPYSYYQNQFEVQPYQSYPPLSFDFLPRSPLNQIYDLNEESYDDGSQSYSQYYSQISLSMQEGQSVNSNFSLNIQNPSFQPKNAFVQQSPFDNINNKMLLGSIQSQTSQSSFKNLDIDSSLFDQKQQQQMSPGKMMRQYLEQQSLISQQVDQKPQNEINSKIPIFQNPENQIIQQFHTQINPYNQSRNFRSQRTLHSNKQQYFNHKRQKYYGNEDYNGKQNS